MIIRMLTAAIAATGFLTGSALAHPGAPTAPGHGQAEHFLTQPDHVAMIVVALVASGLLVRTILRRRAALQD